MMARKAKDQREKEHLHWQETFRVFTTPSTLPGNVVKVDKDGKEVTLPPRTLEEAGFDKEPKLADRELPIDEFRYKGHSKIAYLEIMLSISKLQYITRSINRGGWCKN